MSKWLAVVLLVSPALAETELETNSDLPNLVSIESEPGLWHSQFALTGLQAKTQTWDEATRAEVHAATRVLAETCPYNRASMELPIALHLAAQQIEGDGLGPNEREAWRTLKAGIELHVSVLEGTVGPALTEVRSPLEGARDPLAALFLDEVSDRVAALDAMELDAIRAASDTLAAHTDGHWPLERVTLGWQLELERQSADFEGSDDEETVRRIIAVLESYAGMGC